MFTSNLVGIYHIKKGESHKLISLDLYYLLNCTFNVIILGCYNTLIRYLRNPQILEENCVFVNIFLICCLLINCSIYVINTFLSSYYYYEYSLILRGSKLESYNV